ncbi:hypothetical protein MVEN_01280300 [Mycena venus]|uniref:Uncharacterized protein n=1 Tax=Mycena venus TaxID=2733690 RepID=A0A8H6XZ83_9AGAR|nr:hypothetical protein MVEN_01280300 [Mycena venus]
MSEAEAESGALELERFGFFISPLTPPDVPDVLICSVDPRFKIATLVGALSSKKTPISTLTLSRWLFLVARGLSSARPIRPPAVYRRITVVGADVFVRRLAGIGAETFSCDSSTPLPPGCYALFLGDKFYPHPIGQKMPRLCFTETEPAWTAPDDDFRASYRMNNPVPDNLATDARKRDCGLCCFTGRPSDCITWVIPPLLCGAVSPPAFALERCLCLDNVFTISSDLLQAYQDNRIAADPQDGYRIVAFGELCHPPLLDRLRSLPTSGRFWHASLTWALSVRFTGCDIGFRDTPIADRLIEELSWEGARMIPKGSKWSTAAGKEAIRTFLWARAGCPLPSGGEEGWDTPPQLPSDTTSSPSDRADHSDQGKEFTVSQHSVRLTMIPWILFYTSWIGLSFFFVGFCTALSRMMHQ